MGEVGFVIFDVVVMRAVAYVVLAGELESPHADVVCWCPWCILLLS